MDKQNIYGYWVVYEKEMVQGIRYLKYDLQREEARTLFEAAKDQGDAEFEDDDDRDWSLRYNRGENSYTLFRRQRE